MLKVLRNYIGYFVEWHINLRGLFNAKAILVEEQQLYPQFRGVEE